MVQNGDREKNHEQVNNYHCIAQLLRAVFTVITLQRKNEAPDKISHTGITSNCHSSAANTEAK